MFTDDLEESMSASLKLVIIKSKPVVLVNTPDYFVTVAGTDDSL